MNKKYFYALATYTGTIVGAGIFGLPYVASRAGLTVMIIYLLIIAFMSLSAALLFGQVISATHGHHRLPGYVAKYMGNKWRHIAFFTTVIGLTGVLLTYIILGGEFLHGIFNPLIGGSILVYTLAYFALGAYLIFRQAKVVARIEIIMLVFIVLMVIIFLIFGWPEVNLNNIKLSGNNIFLPFGVLIFSLWGLSVMPEVVDMMEGEQKKVKSIVPTGILIAVLIYFVFIILVWGISGGNISTEAIPGLSVALGRKILLFGYIFGFLATFTSFISIGMVVKKIYWYDYRVPRNYAWFFALFIPLALYLLGMKDFIEVIGITGAFALGLEGIIILLLCLKTRKKCPKKAAYQYKLPTFVKVLFILLFATGVAFQIINLIKK